MNHAVRPWIRAAGPDQCTSVRSRSPLWRYGPFHSWFRLGLDDQRSTVAIRDVGRVNHRVHQQAPGFDPDRALLAADFLLGIILFGIDAASPFRTLHALAVDDSGRGTGFPLGLFEQFVGRSHNVTHSLFSLGGAAHWLQRWVSAAGSAPVREKRVGLSRPTGRLGYGR
jgi:hypothetical protein